MNTVSIQSKRKITDADRAAARRLSRIWKQKAPVMGLTQKVAAAQMGMTQSALSQYLNERLALNTDAILKFAALLHISPTEIRADVLNKLKTSNPSIFTVETRSVPIRQTLSGEKSSGEVLVPVPLKNKTVYAIDVNSSDYAPYIGKNDLVIVDPEKKIAVGKRVVVQKIDEIKLTIGTVEKITSRSYTIRSLATTDNKTPATRIPKSDIQLIQRIIAITER